MIEDVKKFIEVVYLINICTVNRNCHYSMSLSTKLVNNIQGSNEIQGDFKINFFSCNRRLKVFFIYHFSKISNLTDIVLKFVIGN